MSMDLLAFYFFFTTIYISYSLNGKRGVGLLHSLLASENSFCTTSLLDELDRLASLLSSMEKALDLSEKIAVLVKEEKVVNFLARVSLSGFSPEETFAILSVVSIGQEKIFSDL